MLKEPKKLKSATWYNSIHRRKIKKHGGELTEIRERYKVVLPWIVGESVLDLGCGLGFMADMVGERRYRGVDFSHIAIAYAIENTQNPNAKFITNDILKVRLKPHDTVLMLELLEHVDNPRQVAKKAILLAERRVIATLPRDMRGKSHVWPTWSILDINRMFGALSVCQLFGGKNDDVWWLIVKDILQ